MRITSNIIVLSAFITCINPVFSQGTNNQENVDLVAWAKQYPVEKEDSKSTFFQKVNTLVFGEKPDLIANPVSVTGDNSGNLWLMSQGNGRVLKISEDKISSPLDDLFKKNRPFPSLVSSCIVPGKGLIFTDSYLNQALLLSEEAGKIGEFNNQKELSQPTGIAYSVKTSQVWIVETAAHRISIFNLEGNFIKSIGSRGSGEGEFNFPTHIWIDEAGTAYVVDALNCRIQIFDGTGKYISSFGKAGNATGSIARPKGIATDSYGNIYIADALFNAIQIFDNTGKFLYYFGSQGSEHGEFWMPAGIFIDHKNYIYVSDSFNNRIQVFHLRKSE